MLLTFTTSRNHGYFTTQIGHIVQIELFPGEVVRGSAEVLGNGLLDGIHSVYP